MLTMKGWFTLSRMFFSFWTCWTCLSRMTSAMAKIFSAQYSRVLFSRQRTTRPNVPVPKLTKKIDAIERVGAGYLFVTKWRVDTHARTDWSSAFRQPTARAKAPPTFPQHLCLSTRLPNENTKLVHAYNPPSRVVSQCNFLHLIIRSRRVYFQTTSAAPHLRRRRQ